MLRLAEPGAPPHEGFRQRVRAFVKQVLSGEIERELEAHPEQAPAIVRHLQRKRTAHWAATAITRNLDPDAAAQVDREQREMRRLERLARRSAHRGRVAQRPQVALRGAPRFARQ